MHFLTVITMVCATTVIAADESGGMSLRIAEVLERESHYEPKKEASGTEAPDDEVLVLPTLFVHPPPKGLEEAVEAHQRKVGYEKFSWAHGGTILKKEDWPLPFDLKFKYNPEHNGIDLLSFSW